MGVQVHGQVEALAQRGHQRARRRSPEEAGHVLDAECVRAEVLELLGQIDVPVDAVNRADRVADRGLRVFAAGFHFANRPIDVSDVVERIEDAKDVDAVGGGPFNEPLEHVVRIVAIAHEVLAP